MKKRKREAASTRRRFAAPRNDGDGMCPYCRHSDRFHRPSLLPDKQICAAPTSQDEQCACVRDAPLDKT